jgi:hypothetical protein
LVLPFYIQNFYGTLWAISLLWKSFHHLHTMQQKQHDFLDSNNMQEVMCMKEKRWQHL